MTTPFLAQLRSVWAASPTDVWAVGTNHILHYTGGQWVDVAKPGGATSGMYIRVWGISSDDIFVIDGTGQTGQVNSVWRRLNGSWSNVLPSTNGYTWTAMQGSGSNLWVVGHLNNGVATAAHWNGSAFVLENNVNGAIQSGAADSYDITVASDGTTYFTADNANVLRRISTDNWTYVVQATHLVATSSSDATGFDFTMGAKHYNGSAWTVIPDTANVLIVRAVHGVAGSTLVVGTGGHILDCTASACTPSQTNVVDDLYDTFVLDATHAFVVGDYGTVLY